MKDPKEMSDDELYQYLRARKIRLQVAQEISTTYTPQSIMITTLHNPVYGATKASITQSSSVTSDYTKVRIEDIIKEMDSRGLDSKKYDDDEETNVVVQKWIRAWKSAKILGTVAGLDLTEIYDVIELCNNMGDIITDFGELAGDISEIASDVGNMIAESPNGVNVGEILQNASETVNFGNEILVDAIDVSEDAQDIINDIKDSKENASNPEIIETKGDEIVVMTTASDTKDSKDISTSTSTSNAAAIINLQEITNQIIQMVKIDEKLKKIPASFSSSNNENNPSVSVAEVDIFADSAVATKTVI